jgi:altronate hydrolase
VKRAIKVEPVDNVVVVVQNTRQGDPVDFGEGTVAATQDIPLGHKIAVSSIAKSGFAVKYGVPIGRASTAINAGDHVHSHNIDDVTEELCNQYESEFRSRGGAK